MSQCRTAACRLTPNSHSVCKSQIPTIVLCGVKAFQLVEVTEYVLACLPRMCPD